MGWPYCIKMAQSGESKVTGIAVRDFFMTIAACFFGWPKRDSDGGRLR